MSVRLAIVGCGAVAERYHVPAVAASSEAELVAVCDVSLERARALALAAGAEHATDRYETLASTVDAAIVATPNHAHAPVTIGLLEAGLHVLVEKPMAPSVAECDAMNRLARARGLTLAVGHDFRFFPVAMLAKELLVSGLLGDVIRADVQQSATGRWPYGSDYIFSPATAGGGVLLDFGVHVLDLLGWWLGESRVVSFRDDAVGGVESECELSLELVSGAPVSVELSRVRPLRDTAVVACERGTIEIGIFEPALVRLTVRGGSSSLVGDAPDALFTRAPLEAVFGRQLSNFLAAIASGEEPLVSGEEGRSVIETVEAAYGCRQALRRPWDFPEAYTVLGQGAP